MNYEYLLVDGLCDGRVVCGTPEIHEPYHESSISLETRIVQVSLGERCLLAEDKFKPQNGV